MNYTETNFHPVVSDAEFKRFLRFPLRRPLEGPLAENAAWARSWFATHARPWFCGRELPLRVEEGESLLVSNEPFGSPVLARWFIGAERAVAVVASAGADLDAETAARWALGEPDRYFFLECYGAAVVEALLVEFGRRIAVQSSGLAPMPCYCPGFADWPADEAPRFLNLIRSAGGLPGPVEALASGALRPKKTKLALFVLKPLDVPAVP